MQSAESGSVAICLIKSTDVNACCRGVAAAGASAYKQTQAVVRHNLSRGLAFNTLPTRFSHAPALMFFAG